MQVTISDFRVFSCSWFVYFGGSSSFVAAKNDPLKNTKQKINHTKSLKLLVSQNLLIAKNKGGFYSTPWLVN